MFALTLSFGQSGKQFAGNATCGSFRACIRRVRYRDAHPYQLPNCDLPTHIS
jgi:hypothetical protein